jgi:hypothetical protein
MFPSWPQPSCVIISLPCLSHAGFIARKPSALGLGIGTLSSFHGFKELYWLKFVILWLEFRVNSLSNHSGSLCVARRAKYEVLSD